MQCVVDYSVLAPRKQLGIVVPRKQVPELHVKEHAEIGIVNYRFSNYARQTVKFLDLPKLPETGSRIDQLWELSFSLQEPVPNWSKTMHILHQGQAHPGSSSIIEIRRHDMYLLHTELCAWACYKSPCPTVITFDHLLFWKVHEIEYGSPAYHPLKDTIVRWDTLNILLGAIGTLMEGSGLT